MLVQQSAFAWTISQNFDDQAVGASCGWDASDGSRVSSEKAFGGTKSCKLSVNKGATAFGSWGGILIHPTKVGRGGQVWLRVRTFMPTGFNYDSVAEGNRLKFLRIHTMSDTQANYGYADWYINPKGTSPPFSFIYEGEQVWGTLSASKDAVVLGKWETYEFYVKLDTAAVSKGGQGIVRAWKDGVLISELRDRMTLATSSAYSDRTHLFTYWNGGAPLTQSMYVDDVTLTTDTPSGRDAAGNPYIGMGVQQKIPAPPSSVAAE